MASCFNRISVQEPTCLAASVVNVSIASADNLGKRVSVQSAPSRRAYSDGDNSDIQSLVKEMHKSCSVTSRPDNFNVLRVGIKFPEKPLACVGFAALLEVSKGLGLHIDRLENFCMAVDDSMPPGNAYHNKLHVADVTQMMYCLTCENGPLCEFSRTDPKVILAAILAAMVHDLNHPGFTNAFLNVTKHPLTQEYGTESTNEKMHAKLFQILVDSPSMNFLEPLGATDRSRVMDWVQQAVLATDMAKHGSFLSSPPPEDSDSLLVYKLKYAMKISDLSHCMRPFRVHSLIVGMLKDEFYTQGDKEKSLGIRVSFGMNRFESDPEVAAGQADFLAGVIEPLVSRYNDFCGGGSPTITGLIDVLQRNVHSWRVLAQTDEAWKTPLYSDQKLDARLRLENSYKRPVDMRSQSIRNVAAVHAMICDADALAKLVDEADQILLSQQRRRGSLAVRD